MQLKAIPELNPHGDIYKTLGPNDVHMYYKSLGKLTAACVYVEFEGHESEWSPEVVFNKMIANGEAIEWYKKQSYGKFQLEFVSPKTEWRKMSKAFDAYEARTTEGHRAYIEEAINLFPEIDYTQYHFVLVIPSNTEKSGNGTACFSEIRDEGAKSQYGMNHLAVTFDNSHFTPTSFYTLNHELGHCLGLPDTYDYRIKGLAHREPAGSWDLMCDVDCGENFLGWHRHKLEWLDDDRKTYVTEKEFECVLTPLSNNQGLSMLVVPVDDEQDPSKVFVIELALPIREKHKSIKDSRFHGEGVLVYHVDAKRETGDQPLLVYPKSNEYSDDYFYLYKAPYLVGDTFDHPEAPMKIDVLEQIGKDFRIKVTQT